jgi:hypothetical protein
VTAIAALAVAAFESAWFKRFKPLLDLLLIFKVFLLDLIAVLQSF